MHRKIFIDQLKRSKKTVVYFWLLLIAATFFVTSMNLYYNSTSNLQLPRTLSPPWLSPSCMARWTDTESWWNATATPTSAIRPWG